MITPFIRQQINKRLLVGLAVAILMLIIATLLYRQWIFGSAHFAFAPGRTPDQRLPIDDPLPGVSLSVTTPNDFPEFLGAGRRAAVDHISIDPNWSQRPPRQLWRHPVGAGWSAFSVVNGFAVTMEQRGDHEMVSCYNLISGRHHWSSSWNERFTINGVGPRSTPTIDSGRVYALGAWGHLVCLDGATGEVIWKREIMHDLGLHWTDENKHVRFGRANSPLVVDKLVIVPGGGLPGKRASLLAYDASTGAPRWRGGEQQISYSSPIRAELLGEQQIISVNESTVSGHALTTGEEIWSYPWPGDSSSDANVSQPVPLSTNRLLLTKGYRKGASLIELFRPTQNAPIQTRCIWHHSSILNTKFTNVVIWQNHAYGLSDGVLECINLETGERRWKAGRYGHGQILRVREHLLILGETGILSLVRLDPDTPNALIGQIQALTGTTWNNLALYGNLLIIRNATEAVCYDLATMGNLNKRQP
jgi:outer membrane protein assembly factor BamB